jgi:pimeloyl-ACP methyl ester carboxylesterase
VAGDGPAILFVHGAGGGFDQGLDFGSPLVTSGFRVVAMSRFGYLRTPLPLDASPAAQADAHACLLDALGVERAAVIGGSAGAPSSLQLAARHPERVSALILIVPATYAPRENGSTSLPAPPGTERIFTTALQSDFLFWAATRVAKRTLIRTILATPTEVIDGASPDERARVDAILDHILPVSARRLGLLNDAAVTSRLERVELERITAPTLVISAADDLYGTFDAGRYTADHIPAARFVGYPAGGHVWVGHQQQLIAEIEAFLREDGA